MMHGQKNIQLYRLQLATLHAWSLRHKNL